MWDSSLWTFEILDYVWLSKAKDRKWNLTCLYKLSKSFPLQAQPSPGRHQRQAEAAFGVRIERLNQELSTKTRTIQELSRTVERLQKERRNMLSVPNPRPETCSTETRRHPGPAKTLYSATAGETCGGEDTFPAAHYEKTYQPTVFTGKGVDALLWSTFLCMPRWILKCVTYAQMSQKQGLLWLC